MKLRFLCWLFGVFCAAAPAQQLTLSGPGQIAPGPNTIVVNLVGASPAAAQFQITFPPSVTAFSAAPATAAQTAAKTVQCTPLAASQATCVVIPSPSAPNSTAISAGPLVTFTVTATNPTGAQTFTISAIIGASPTASAIVIAAGPPLTLSPIAVPCDVNRDGRVDSGDLQVIQDVILGAPIPSGAMPDQNGDGVVNVRDYQIVVLRVLGDVCVGR